MSPSKRNLDRKDTTEGMNVMFMQRPWISLQEIRI